MPGLITSVRGSSSPKLLILRSWSFDEFLTKTSFLHVREDLVIDVALFALGQYCGCSGNGCLLREESDGIAQYREREVRPKVMDWPPRGAVLSEYYSHHDSHLLGHTVYLTVKAFLIWSLAGISHRTSSVI